MLLAMITGIHWLLADQLVAMTSWALTDLLLICNDSCYPLGLGKRNDLCKCSAITTNMDYLIGCYFMEWVLFPLPSIFGKDVSMFQGLRN